MIEGGYKQLEVYQLAHKLAVQIHELTLGLPKFEMYEEGSQIRKSSKSVSSQIVEGYCLRKYKNDFLLYLLRAYASAEETIEHLEFLIETRSFGDQERYRVLRDGYELLCKKLFKLIQSVGEMHEKPHSVKESSVDFLLDLGAGNP